MDGVREVQDLIDAVQRRDGEVVRARRRLRGDRRRAGRARGPDQRRRRLERRAQRRHRDGGAALSARRRRRHDALRRREAPRGAGPAAAPAPRPPAARRADQPPRRRVGRVARALPRRVRGHGGRRHPRSLFPRQRCANGSSSWIAAAGSRSRATTRAGWSRSSTGCRSEQKPADARQRTLARELEWVRMGAKARQAKGKARLSAYEKLLAEANDAKETARELEIAIPPGPRLGDQVIEDGGPAQGLRRPAADRGPDVLAAAGGHRRDHRAQRRRQDDAVPDAGRPGGGRRRRR